MAEFKAIEFTECKPCGSEKTISQIGLEQSGAPPLPIGVKVGLEQTIIPLGVAPGKLDTGRALIILWDACADCGTMRVVRVEEQRKKKQMIYTGGGTLPFGRE